MSFAQINDMGDISSGKSEFYLILLEINLVGLLLDKHI